MFGDISFTIWCARAASKDKSRDSYCFVNLIYNLVLVATCINIFHGIDLGLGPLSKVLVIKVLNDTKFRGSLFHKPVTFLKHENLKQLTYMLNYGNHLQRYQLTSWVSQLILLLSLYQTNLYCIKCRDITFNWIP